MTRPCRRVPDYVDDIVREATRHRQRPRWTFVERWWHRRRIGRPRPATQAAAFAWRRHSLRLARRSALLLAAIAIRRQPAAACRRRSDRARTGLIAFVRAATSSRTIPATGLESAARRDRDRGSTTIRRGRSTERGSRSCAGTRSATCIGFVDRDGGRPVSRRRAARPTSTLTASPGRQPGAEVAVNAGPHSSRSIVIVNALDGRIVPLDIIGPTSNCTGGRRMDGSCWSSHRMERPPACYLYSLDDGSRELLWPGDGEEVRPRGWLARRQTVVTRTSMRASAGAQDAHRRRRLGEDDGEIDAACRPPLERRDSMAADSFAVDSRPVCACAPADRRRAVRRRSVSNVHELRSIDTTATP